MTHSSLLGFSAPQFAAGLAELPSLARLESPLSRWWRFTITRRLAAARGLDRCDFTQTGLGRPGRAACDLSRCSAQHSL